MGEWLVGEIRIGAEPMVIHEFIAKVTSDFMRFTNSVNIRVLDEAPSVILDSLATGKVDIGFLPFSPDAISKTIFERFDLIALADINLKLAVPIDRASERTQIRKRLGPVGASAAATWVTWNDR